MLCVRGCMTQRGQGCCLPLLCVLEGVSRSVKLSAGIAVCPDVLGSAVLGLFGTRTAVPAAPTLSQHCGGNCRCCASPTGILVSLCEGHCRVSLSMFGSCGSCRRLPGAWPLTARLLCGGNCRWQWLHDPSVEATAGGLGCKPGTVNAQVSVPNQPRAVIAGGC